MPTVYPPLTMKAPLRLAMFKREAAKPSWARPLTWRDVRFANLRSSSGLDRGLNDKTPIWYSHDGAQFRNEKFCDESENSRINHTGWYCDEYCEEKTRGIIASLPHGRFIAGYWMSMSDERVYFPEIFTDEREAANMADEHARVIAEQEAEHNVRFNEAQTLETEIEDSFARLRECICLRHVACMRYIRDEISELIQTIRDKRESLASDYADVL